MCRRSIILAGLFVIVCSMLLLGCGNGSAPTEQKASVEGPTEQSFVPPMVSLNFVEVAHYWGWWYFSNKVEPTKGKAGKYGAPLDLAFIFDVENPNPYPVMMEELKFTVAFEEFDLNTVSSHEVQWIPAGKTNQLRVHAMFDGQQSLLSLLVTGGFKLEEKGMGAGPGAALKQLETWWTGIPEFSFPVHVKEGSAIFKADTLTKVGTFGGTFPPQ
ncbi:MAG: hypothetical protein SWE60_08785 [Thermodesulfobacteriota bacterium]|nr:hypothetical protein [Thermodesulfobacteriota bacterium]